MKRRTLFLASAAIISSASGCLSNPLSSPVSESAIEACEIDYIERELFADEDPPSIDASVTSAESYDNEYYRVVVESHWLVYSLNTTEILVEPLSSSPDGDVTSAEAGPFSDLDAFHETLSKVVESGEETALDSDHDEWSEIRDAFFEVFDITEPHETEPKEVTLEYDGHTLEASFWVQELHGDGEEHAVYFVSESETYRVENADGEPDDGEPVEC